MLTRADFSIPEDILYWNFAGMSALPQRVLAAGRLAVERKSQPWTLPIDYHFFAETDLARAEFAGLIGAQLEDIALQSSATYGVETFSRNLLTHGRLKTGDEILMPDEEFPALRYPLTRLAQQTGARLVRVPCPQDQNWTRALSEAINSRTRVLALTPCHWTDGARIDVQSLAQIARDRNAMVIVDVCQFAGAVPLNVRDWQVDVVVAPTYKWLLGPYSFSFMYVSPHSALKMTEPLEEYWASREGAQDFTALVRDLDTYQAGARRFDVGERANLQLLPMAIEALRLIRQTTPEKISDELSTWTDLLAHQLGEMGFQLPPPEQRSPHMLGLRHPHAWRAGLMQRLEEQRIFVSQRGEVLRLSPHLNISATDVEKLLRALRDEL
jgi:selenocysteine lyase/cysteine desulfurase